MFAPYRLVVHGGPANGRVLDLTAPITIGRLEGNVLALAADPQVSRQHARIELQGGAVVLTDLGSANGSFVNGQRVSGVVQLRPGDVVQIGASTLLLQPASTVVAPPANPPVSQVPSPAHHPPGAAPSYPSPSPGSPHPPVGVAPTPGYAPAGYPPAGYPAGAPTGRRNVLPWAIAGGAVALLLLGGIGVALVAGRGGSSESARVPGAGQPVVVLPSPSPAPIITPTTVMGLAGTNPAPPPPAAPVVTGAGAPPVQQPSGQAPSAPPRPAASPTAASRPGAAPPPMMGDVMKPNATPRPAPAGMATFTSQRGGYQMRVPSAWKHEQDADTDRFSEPNDAAVIVVEFGRPGQTVRTPRDLVQRVQTSLAEQLREFSKGDVQDGQIGGQPAASFPYAYTTQSGTRVVAVAVGILVPGQTFNEAFYIWRGIAVAARFSEFEPIFESSLSSFRITGRPL